MTPQYNRIVEILGVLSASFPNFDLKEQTIQIYCIKLADLDPDLLSTAADMHISSQKFFPTIAELRGAVASLIERGLNTASAIEAWGIVVEKMKTVGNTVDFGGYHPDCFADKPLIDKVVKSMGWNELCRTENAIADRARFLQAYEVELSRAREDMKFLPETHNAIERLQAENASESIKQLTARMTVK